jgi:hypothetical protein
MYAKPIPVTLKWISINSEDIGRILGIIEDQTGVHYQYTFVFRLKNEPKGAWEEYQLWKVTKGKGLKYVRLWDAKGKNGQKGTKRRKSERNQCKERKQQQSSAQVNQEERKRREGKRASRK